MKCNSGDRCWGVASPLGIGINQVYRQKWAFLVADGRLRGQEKSVCSQVTHKHKHQTKLAAKLQLGQAWKLRGSYSMVRIFRLMKLSMVKCFNLYRWYETKSGEDLSMALATRKHIMEMIHLKMAKKLLRRRTKAQIGRQIKLMKGIDYKEIIGTDLSRFTQQ